MSRALWLLSEGAMRHVGAVVGIATLCAAGAAAQGGSVTDGAVTLTYPATHWGGSGSPLASLTGTEPVATASPVYASGLWYRTVGSTREQPLPAPDSVTYNGNVMQARWNNLGGQNFEVVETTKVYDAERPSGGFVTQVEVHSALSSPHPRAFTLFHYLDMDLGVGGDSGTLAGRGFLKITNGNEAVLRYRAWRPSRWDVRAYPLILSNLADADLDNLSGSNSFGPGDATAAFQWDLNVAGLSTDTVFFSVSSRLARDRIKGSMLSLEPYPALWTGSLRGYSARGMRRNIADGGWLLFAQPPGFLGVDDFDGDLVDERVTRDPTTGNLYIEGSIAPVTPAPGPTQRLATTGDYNGDGRADLMFSDTSTQKLSVWLMNGSSVIGSMTPSPDQAANSNWDLAGSADFDGDGAKDLLWFNRTSRNVVIWYMNPLLVRVRGEFTNPTTVASGGWHVVAVGDYGRGAAGEADTADIVWQNDTSGRVVIWYMNRASTRTSGVFTTPDVFGSGEIVLGPR